MLGDFARLAGLDSIVAGPGKAAFMLTCRDDDPVPVLRLMEEAQSNKVLVTGCSSNLYMWLHDV